MSAWIRAVLAMALLLVANAAAAKIRSANELRSDKAYLLVQVEPLTMKLMGTNRIATGILFAPYDVRQKQAGPGVMALNDPIAKDGKRHLFLLEIDPGTWTIAGTGGTAAVLGLANTSFSLGSYHFEAKAGEVVDLGVFEPQREETDNPD